MREIKFFKPIAVLIVVASMTACAGPSLREEIVRPADSFASAPSDRGPLWAVTQHIFDRHGAEHSGFRLLDASQDALDARLALIDSAVSSLDIQTYLWYPDAIGLLILERAVSAAERGVRVRLIIDDLMTIGQDQVIYELNQHPNIELRLFNPWEDRSLLARGGEMIAEMERLNHRMHDKLLIADGNGAILGGRNIGEHYFGMNEHYNFHDMDVLGFGKIARQANGMFDSFWNSEAVVSAANIDTEHDAAFAQQAWARIKEKNRDDPRLQRVGVEPRDWQAWLREIWPALHPGTSVLVFDDTEGREIRQNVAKQLFPFMDEAREELLITNAYIIPGERALAFLRGLTERSVRVRILTNSLASHDVPAVNSHYEPWRDDFLEAGVELHELRADASIQSLVDIPPVRGQFVGLHTKAFVVDRNKVFIGSMNFDPRSAAINTEAGAFIHSPGLAVEVAGVMERDMHPDNAWRVQMTDDGDLQWSNSVERLDRQPAREFSQRVMDLIFKIVPKEQY
jgi:putative cardiolipin synthase